MPLRKDRKLKAVKADSVAPETAPIAQNPDAAPITEAITIADIFNAVPNEDTLEALLDAESDEDFGLPEAAAEKRAVLKEWSAQDFANIYTRFRPHLERHARRFLSNQSQVDEVVQDAFLYLMVTLPELDSELGVLRFMKWKVRLLCLDVIRASGRAYINNIDDIAEPESSEPEVGSELEHIEDAAIVRLALSKLNPRHREVLLASMYEEKSAAEIAAQVGLSENATRQLIFRARAAFKTALLGSDVDTTGMSVSAILSVAARKAAAEAKKVGAQAMVLVLFLMVAVGAVVSFNNRGGQTATVAEGSSTPQGSESASASSTPSASASASAAATAEPSASASASPSASASASASATPSESATPIVWESASPVATPTQSPLSATAVQGLFKPASVAYLVPTNVIGDEVLYRSYSDQGIFADFNYSTSNKVQPFKNLVLTFMVKDVPFFTYPSNESAIFFADRQGNPRVVYYADLKYTLDRDKKTVLSENPLAKSTMRIEAAIDPASGRLNDINLIVLQGK